MSRLGDFLNKIKDKIIPSKTLKLAENAEIDPLLKERVDRDGTLEFFESPGNFNAYCQNYFSIGDNFEKQYDYLNIISQMEQSGSMEEFKKYYFEVQNNPSLYFPSQVHGIAHTSRVTFFAEMLCSIDNLSMHDRDLIMRAAQFHDIGREDDRKNFDHGLASKEKLDRWGTLSAYPPRDQEIIKFAVECHSLDPDQVQKRLKNIPRKDRKDFKMVLDYLQDADKLDRTRIAAPEQAKLDPTKLATNTAKRLVKIAHQNFYKFDDLIDYELNKEQYQAQKNNLQEAFSIARESGFKVSFEDFKYIVEQYEEGTLETLMKEGRVTDIFDYKTFKNHSISETPETVKQLRDGLFSEIQENDQIQTLDEVFDSEFMLHLAMYDRHKESYSLYKHANVDMSLKYASDVISEIKITDLDKLFARGYYLRTTDLVYLASNLTAEEYRDAIDNGRVEDLFSSKYEKSSYNYERVQTRLKELGINYDQNTIDTNYRFIEEIITYAPDILKEADISNYSFAEIYASISKLTDASLRITNKEKFKFNTQDIKNLMDYSRIDTLIYNVSEKEQLDIVQNLVENKDAVKDPRYVQYMIKKNKPYTTTKIDEILNYNRFCADSILLDQNITLEDAKARLIDGLFNMDVPAEYKAQFQKEIQEELYYHKKYMPDSFLHESGSIAEQISQILSAGTITEFKDLLYANREALNSINTHNLGDKVKSDLMEITGIDLAYQLQQTGQAIRNSASVATRTESGKPVDVKVLSGQPFFLATSTSMPKCSFYTHKILREQPNDARQIIYDQMLNRSIEPNEICTSIESDKMLAHAASALQDQELVYGFVPEAGKDISIAGMYDLATTKKNSTVRHTDRAITPRSASDLTLGTTEEHNEVIMSAYPDFIVCYDKVTDIALEKQQILQREYDEKGIDKKVEIVFVDAKGIYIPQIQNNIMKEHIDIERKIRAGTFSESDFTNMFEQKESNFVLRTLQSIHSTSYRDDVWDPEYNSKVLDSMTRILGEIAEIVPPNKARTVFNQVEILLERADRKKPYGSRFYDHAYSEDIDTQALNGIRSKLAMKVFPYERGDTSQVQAKPEPKSELKIENLQADGIVNKTPEQEQISENNRKRPETPDDDAR